MPLSANGNDRPRKRPTPNGMDGFIRPNVNRIDTPLLQPALSTDTRKSLPTSQSERPIDQTTHPAQPSLGEHSLVGSSLPNYGSGQSNTPIPNTPVKRKGRKLWKRSETVDKKPKKKKNKIKVVLLSLAALILVGAGAAAWDALQLKDKLHHLQVGNLTTSVGGAENILVAGSTNRCNLSVQNAEWGFCSQGVTGVNSDVIFIVHLVPATHTMSILSIPRDTFVPNARSGDQAFKVDAALYQGPTQLVQAVQEDFGIPIQHYAEVGFDGFQCLSMTPSRT